MTTPVADRDTAFEMAAGHVRFGRGVTHEVGMDLAELGVRRAMVVTDRHLADLPPVAAVRQSLQTEGIEYRVFDCVRIEPNDRSMHQAIDFARSGGFDSFVAVGGGSTIDTAKIANLYSTHPADWKTYINAPIGEGQPVPGPLKPLVAIPTTAGTGSETTGVAIFDVSDLHVKTGIAHRRLKPLLGLVDPDNTRTMPPAVAASTGLDVLCHALESYTAIPYTARPRPKRPSQRPTYQGNNPISDLWSLRAIELVSQYLLRAYRDPADEEARENMLLASTYAGIGFGNAGVHLCHGMSYPVSGMVRAYDPPGYDADHPLVPHGVSVALCAPAVFRFAGPACPERHRKAAELLGVDIVEVLPPEEAGHVLADRLVQLMQLLDLPNGLAALGYTAADAPTLARGTLPQRRINKLCPRRFTEDDLVRLFEQSLVLWRVEG
jgi:hydroxyacid-oxoacid transhydrogenase